MPKPHPPELRDRVVRAYLDGKGTYAEIATLFSVGEATVNRWVSRFRSTGTAAARPAGGQRPPRLTPAALEYIRTLVTDEPNWTTSELAAQVEEDFGIRVSRHVIGRALRSMDITFKRGSFVPLVPVVP